MNKSKLIIALVASWVIGPAARASMPMTQSGDDWDLQTVSEQRLTQASLGYSSGLTLSVECRDDALSVVALGLPIGPDTHPRTIASRPDGAERATIWTRSDNGALQTGSPRLARLLAEGGALTLRTTGGSGAPVRLDLDLPKSSASVRRVLAACRFPLADARDQLAAGEDYLQTAPRISPPASAYDSPSSQIEFSCIIRDSRLQECQADRVSPPSPTVGARVARGANGTAVSLTDRAVAEGRLIDIVVVTSRSRH